MFQTQHFECNALEEKNFYFLLFVFSYLVVFRARNLPGKDLWTYFSSRQPLKQQTNCNKLKCRSSRLLYTFACWIVVTHLKQLSEVPATNM